MDKTGKTKKLRADLTPEQREKAERVGRLEFKSTRWPDRRVEKFIPPASSTEDGLVENAGERSWLDIAAHGVGGLCGRGIRRGRYISRCRRRHRRRLVWVVNGVLPTSAVMAFAGSAPLHERPADVLDTRRRA